MDSGEVDLADVIAFEGIYVIRLHRNTVKKLLYLRIIEAESSFSLIVRDLPRDLRNVAVERSTDEIEIAEDERLFEIETDSNDISCVLRRKGARLLRF